MRNRSAKGASEEDGHSADHYTRLAEDFGFARSGYRAIDEGRPMSRIRFLLQPLSLFVMSLTALVLVCGLQLWRMGMFDPLFAAKSAVVDKAPKRWLLNGRATRVSDDRIVPTGEPEAAFSDKPPPRSAEDESEQ
jgi:hypothetical protein